MHRKYVCLLPLIVLLAFCCINCGGNVPMVIFLAPGELISENNVIQPDGNGQIIPPEYEREGYRFSGWYYDADFTRQWNGETPDTDITLYGRWVSEFSASYDLTLPLVLIQTDTGESIRSKEEYISAKITVTDAAYDCYIENSPIDIRGRGNTTWTNFPKKPYRFRFQSKTDVLGMGASRDWLLIANYRDAVMMRNGIALTLGSAFGLTETPDYRYVNLVVNGKYQGMYLLCERVERDDTRVSLEKGKTGETSGFLLQVDNAGDVGDDRYFYLNTVEHNNQKIGFDRVSVIIHYPKSENCTDEQVKYIKSYVYALNEAILTRNWEEVCRYLDVDSAVNYFLASELMLSADIGWSFYLHKDAGEKLRFGPLWDYDQSCGNSTQFTTSYKGWSTGHENYWLTSLIKIDEFKALVSERWAEVRSIAEVIPDQITDQIEAMVPDIALNFIEWKGVIGKSLWRIPDELAEIDTYEGNVHYLITWWKNRVAWMDSQLQ